MENIIIELTTKSFRESSDFRLPWGCPIAMALRDLYPDPDLYIGVGGYAVTIGQQCYSIEGSGGKIAFAGISPEQVNQLIWKAKAGEEIETVIVTLIPVE